MADPDADAKLDITLTYQDGGALWWRNLSRPGQLKFQETATARGTNTARRQALIDIEPNEPMAYIKDIHDAYDWPDNWSLGEEREE